MRFLCLHGMGTNAKIFEMQTAAIRYELGDHHTFDFVEGNIPWEIAPEIKNVMPGEQDVFTYFDYNSPPSAVKALNDFETFLETDGPYDGVIAFSQAVALVGTWMVHQVKQRRPIESTFKCAIFLSAGSPSVDYEALQQLKMVPLTATGAGETIDIPTVHIWGREDPWAATASEFSLLCKSQFKSVYIHGGGHEVPGSGSRDAVTRAVNLIRRAINLSDAS